jgi:allantoinase
VYDLVIRGSTVVDPNQQFTADVGITAGKIMAVAPDLAEAGLTEIDAAGLILMPGGIDPHVHFNEPGRADWEGFASGTKALAAGGMTTCFDMPLNSSPPVINAVEFDRKQAAAKASAIVNCYFWGGLIPGNLDALPELHERGVIGFKAFMSNSGIDEFPAADDHTLLEGMRLAAGLGQIVAVHAENDGITSARSQIAIQSGQLSIRDYLNSRPVIAELEAIQRALLFAAETGCKLHIVHVSTGHGVKLVLAAQQQGIDVSCETCPHYLVLTEDDLERLGAVAKCAPPLRPTTDQEALWSLLLAGKLPIIASDHSPAPLSMKQDSNFFSIWGGIAGCQSTLPLLLTEGYHRRGMTLPQIAAVTSANTAQRFGLVGKGFITPGMDADLTLIDLNARYTLTAADLHYRHPISPYIGREFTGQIVRTIVNGQTVYGA